MKNLKKTLLITTAVALGASLMIWSSQHNQPSSDFEKQEVNQLEGGDLNPVPAPDTVPKITIPELNIKKQKDSTLKKGDDQSSQLEGGDIKVPPVTDTVPKITKLKLNVGKQKDSTFKKEKHPNTGNVIYHPRERSNIPGNNCCDDEAKPGDESIHASLKDPVTSKSAADWVRLLNSLVNNPTISGVDRLNQLLWLEKLYIKSECKKDSAYAKMLHRIGTCYFNTGDIEKAIIYTQESIIINQSKCKRVQEGFLCNSFFNLGLYYTKLNDEKKAIFYFDYCIQAGKGRADKISIILEAYEQIGLLSFSLGDYEKCILKAEEGLLLSESLNNSLTPKLLKQIALGQIELNQTEKAEKNILNALSRTNKSDDALPGLYVTYANLLKKEKQGEEAIIYYNKAFDLNWQKRDYKECSSCLVNIGVCYGEDFKNTSKAQAFYEKALTIQKKKTSHNLQLSITT
jgi:tetratricopeptide (TPR) repeat protein